MFTDPANDFVRGEVWNEAPQEYKWLPDIREIRVNATRAGRVIVRFTMSDVLAPNGQYVQNASMLATMRTRSVQAINYIGMGPMLFINGQRTCTGNDASGVPLVRQGVFPAANQLTVSFPVACLPQGQTMNAVKGLSRTMLYYAGPRRVSGEAGRDSAASGGGGVRVR